MRAAHKCMPHVLMRQREWQSLGINWLNFASVRYRTPHSSAAAEQKHRLLTEQIPEPPRRVEAQRRAPRVKGDRLLHAYTDLPAQRAEILDRAVVQIRRVVPAV